MGLIEVKGVVAVSEKQIAAVAKKVEKANLAAQVAAKALFEVNEAILELTGKTPTAEASADGASTPEVEAPTKRATKGKKTGAAKGKKATASKGNGRASAVEHVEEL